MDNLLLFEKLERIYNKIQKLNIDGNIRCLTQNELHIISNIDNDDMTVNDLAKKLDLTMGTVSIAINKLENKQFIERIKDNHDKRKVYVRLTEKGKISKNFNNDFNSDIYNKVFENISEESRKTFFEVLEKIIEQMNNIKNTLEPVCINELEKGDIATIEQINSRGTILRYLSSIGFIYGKTIKILDIDKYNYIIDIEGIRKQVNKEDLKNVYVLKKGI